VFNKAVILFLMYMLSHLHHRDETAAPYRSITITRADNLNCIGDIDAYADVTINSIALIRIPFDKLPLTER